MAKARKPVTEDFGAVFAASNAPAEPAGSETKDANGQPRRRYVKDLIRAGRWSKGAVGGVTFDVPVKRLKHWADSFAKMKAAGIKVPVPLGHTTDPEKNRGEVVDMFVEGDTLYGVIDLIGHDSLPLASRAEVSIFAEPTMMSGDGQRYDDVITHVALVTDPVVNNQDGFTPVAASRGEVRVPVMRLAMENGANMDWKELAALLGIDITGLDDTTGPAKVKEVIQAQLAASKNATQQVAQAEQQVAAAKAETAAAVAASRKIDLDPDMLDVASNNVRIRTAAMVKAGKIGSKTAAAAVKLFGDEPMSLSRKASKALGFKIEKSLADAVLDLLDLNDPVEMAEAVKSQTPAGSAFGRAVPGAEPAKPDPAAVQKDIQDRASRAYGVRKSA